MKKLLIVVVLSVILCACGGTKVTLKEKIEAEYGTELKVEDLTDQKGIKLKETKNYDAKKVGQQTITVIFTDEDEKEIEQEVTLEIKDTKAPEIKLKKEKVEITEGDKFDSASNIESVKDPVDGDIKKSDDKKITKNGYIITSDVDAKKVKNGYKVKVTAFDVNGNKAEKEYTVNVKAKSKEKPQASTSQSTTSGGQAASATPAPSTSQGGSSNAGSGSQSAASPAPANVCPNGNVPVDPTKPCDAVLDWRGANPQRLFSSFEEANQWGDDQMMSNPEYYKKYSGYGAFTIHTNDGTEYGAVTFY